MKNERFSFENIRQTVVVTTKPKIVESILKNLFWIFFDFLSFYLSIFWLAAFLVLDFSVILFVVFLLPLLILNLYTIYVLFVKFYTFKVNQFSIYSDKITKPIKLLFVSDIHTGTTFYATHKIRLRKLINKINSIDKDLVLIGGDFLTYEIKKDFLKIFSEIHGQKIAVYGNHDSDYRRKDGEPIKYEYPSEFIDALEQSGIKVLLNESDIHNINGNSIVIGGIPDLFDLNFDLDKTFENQPTDKFRILLSHNPDIWEFIEDRDGIDLVLSGHLHSGQIHTKLTGPLLPMPSKHKNHTQGLYKISQKTSLLISQGAGYSGTRFKIGVDNEIMIINLLPIST